MRTFISSERDYYRQWNYHLFMQKKSDTCVLVNRDNDNGLQRIFYSNDFWFRTPAYACLQTSLQKLRFNIFIVFAKRKNSHKLYNLYRWKYRLTEQVIVLRCPMQAARMIVEKTFARLMLSSSSSSNVPHKIHFFFSFYWQKMKKSIPQNILIAHLKNDHVEIVSFWEEKTIDK